MSRRSNIAWVIASVVIACKGSDEIARRDPGPPAASSDAAPATVFDAALAIGSDAAPAAHDPCDDVGAREHVVFAPARKQSLEQARAAGIEVSPDGVVKTTSKTGPTMRAFPVEASAMSCREDAWPADVQHCLIAAATLDAWTACLGQLSRKLQRRHDRREANQLP